MGNNGVAGRGGVEVRALTAKKLAFEEGCMVVSLGGTNERNSVYGHHTLPAINVFGREPLKLFLYAMKTGRRRLIRLSRGGQ